jgi:hypothetical protein
MFTSDSRSKKLASDQFKRGCEAMMKPDWDDSRSKFRMCVNLVPENLLFHQSLMGIAERALEGDTTRDPETDLRIQVMKQLIRKHSHDSSWKDVFQSCLDGLALNPADAWLNAEMGNAMQSLGMSSVALFYYQRAVKIEPDNVEYQQLLRRLSGDDGPDSGAGMLVPA